MKTVRNTISKIVKSLAIVMMAMSAQAQTGKVWVTVAEPSALGLKVESGIEQLVWNIERGFNGTSVSCI
jgi:hypothetical protein